MVSPQTTTLRVDSSWPNGHRARRVGRNRPQPVEGRSRQAHRPGSGGGRVLVGTRLPVDGRATRPHDGVADSLSVVLAAPPIPRR
jgi:hypothetical protein